jgi:hypothetical protein
LPLRPKEAPVPEPIPELHDYIFGPGEDSHTDARRALWAVRNDKTPLFRARETGILTTRDRGCTIEGFPTHAMAFGLISGSTTIAAYEAGDVIPRVNVVLQPRSRLIAPGSEIHLTVRPYSQLLIAAAEPGIVLSLIGRDETIYTPFLRDELVAAQIKVAEIAGDSMDELPPLEDLNTLFKLGGHFHRYEELFTIQRGFAAFRLQDHHSLAVTTELLLPSMSLLIGSSISHACWISPGAQLFGHTARPYLSREENDFPSELEPPTLEEIAALFAKNGR